MIPAHFNGSLTFPAVSLTFGFEATHAITGQPLREWVREMPERTWNQETHTWEVTSLGPNPDSTLWDAGFVPLGPDGWECRLSDYVAPLVGRDAVYGMLAVYPRLAGIDAAKPGLPDSAVWRAAEHRWLVPSDADFTGQYADGEVAFTDGVRLMTGPRPAPVAQPAAPAMLDFDGSLDGLRAVPISDLRAADPATAESLALVEIKSVYDLLTYKPRRYIDLSDPIGIRNAPADTAVAVLGTVVNVENKLASTGTPMTVVKVRDPDGTFLSCRWFNVPWMAKRFTVGSTVLVFGVIEPWISDRGDTFYSTNAPLAETIIGETSGRIIAVYPASAKVNLTTWQVHRAAKEAVERMGELVDPVPAALLEPFGLLSRSAAFSAMHCPNTLAEAEAGRQRLAWDELLRMQLSLAIERANETSGAGFMHDPKVGHDLAAQLVAKLPYALTGAQSRALREITGDMAATTPMNRLLQGEVGSGKTVIVALAMLSAVASGRQAALMAPVETLAFQHYTDIAAMCEGLVKADGQPVTVGYLAASVIGKEKKAVVAALAAGQIDIVVGTHALLTDAVTFAALTMVVVDEQHRFGVEQRAKLSSKALLGLTPDLLVATATPAPRTAVLTVFGDLDVSVLDELPPGRSPITTTVVSAKEVNYTDPARTPWSLIREQVVAGHQAFVVCPQVTTSATKEAAATHDVFEALGGPGGALEGLRLGVVTGKDKPPVRREVMDAYTAGDLDVLVATTVIEVGVNVPNATVIAVLGAERFGLTQLHQLRGRVGRGKHAGFAVLVADLESGKADDRMDVMAATTDGFVIAEEDLRIRGAGDLMDARQSGSTKDLRIADLIGDADLLEPAQRQARALVANDPQLNRRPSLRDEVLRAVGADAGRLLATG